MGGPICPLEYRYGRPEVRALFTREARLRRALAVEAALAESEAELGMVPKEAAEEIRRAASDGSVTLERVDALEALRGRAANESDLGDSPQIGVRERGLRRVDQERP